MACVDFQTQRMGEGGHVAQTFEFCVALIKPFFGMGVAIGTCVKFDHLSANPIGRFDLALVGGDEDRHTASGVGKRSDEMSQTVFVFGHFQATFGCAFFAFLGHDANRMGAVPQRNRLHFFGRRHFEIQGH